MCEKLSYQFINNLAVNQEVLCYIQKDCKNHCNKENIDVSGCKQRGDKKHALF